MEMKVFMYPCGYARNISNKKVIKIAEIEGTIYSLEGFEKAVNDNEHILDDNYIRFINN